MRGYFIAVGFFWLIASVAVAADGDVAEPVPSFSTEEGRRTFDAARARFDAGEYEKAEPLFADCRSSTDAEGRATIDRWSQACRCGAQLGKVERAGTDGQWRSAWNTLKALELKYGDTPIGPALDALRAKIEAELFVVLANYDGSLMAVDGDLRAAGAVANEDPKFVRAGVHSAKWSAEWKEGDFPVLKLARLDHSALATHPILSFWVYCPRGTTGQYVLTLGRGVRSIASPQQGSQPKDCRFKVLDLKPDAWNEIRIDVRTDLRNNGVDLEEIKIMELLLRRSKGTQTIYLDELRLERE